MTPPEPNCGEVEGQYAELLRIRTILGEEISHYAKLSPLKTYVDLASTWAILVLSIGAAIWVNSWWFYLLVIPIIAGKQHALGVIAHDGAHYRMSKNRTVNEWVTDYLCMLPSGFSIARWRSEHLAHHRFVNTEKDPYMSDFAKFDQWHWPKTRSQGIKTVLTDLCGLGLMSALVPAKRWGAVGSVEPQLNGAEKFRAITFYGSVITLLAVTGGWLYFFALWVVPIFTCVIVFVRWRTIAEHLGMDGPNDVSKTRHVDTHFLERYTFAPFNINYHIAHHIFPSVPYYNLPALHARLLQEPLYSDNAVIRSGYFGKGSVFEEVTGGRQ